MPREKLGDYRIVREIGRGGMGAVYEATSPQGERVAVKTILSAGAEMDSRSRWEVVERFMMEARAIRALEHRNIVAVTDVGQDEGEFFMVMEFLDGQSVRQLLDMIGAFPIQKASAIIADVCAALSYAHRAGVIHRDIKPDNIVLLKSGVTKLTDFGLARIGEIGTHTQDGTMMGTLAYMSPEQARGERLDARSDLFSLGITFHEMVAGERPFRGEGGAVLQAILTEEPAVLVAAPERVQAALRKCLVKDPAARFQSVEEFRVAMSEPEQGTVIGQPGVSIPGMPTPAATAPPIAAAGPTDPATQLPQNPSPTPAKPVPTRTALKTELPPGWFDTPQPGHPQYRAQPQRAPGGTSTPASQAPQRVKCPCGEMIGWNDAVCWKCGTPNGVVRARSERQQEQATIQEMQRLAASLDPNKKRPWWKKGK